jgi:hypothetical protein
MMLQEQANKKKEREELKCQELADVKMNAQIFKSMQDKKASEMRKNLESIYQVNQLNL